MEVYIFFYLYSTPNISLAMKTTLIILLFTLLAASSKGQNNSYSYFMRQMKIPGSSDTKIVVNQKGDTTLLAHYTARDAINNTYQTFTKNYKGTPYFKNGWFNGTISIENSRTMSFLMAYNVEKSVVYVVEDPEGEATTIKPQTFTIDGHTFKQLNNLYIETIYANKSSILKEYSCALISNKTEQKTGLEPEGSENEYEGEFVKSVKYYLLDGQKLKLIPKGKKVFRLFGSKKLTVEKFAKNNHIPINAEHGLLALFTYYDSLDN